MTEQTNKWYQNNASISGVLLDISGVLYDSSDSGGVVIEGSVEAVKRLKASGVPVRFCTNETSCTRERLVEKLTLCGFQLNASEVFPPPPAVCAFAQQEGLRPHLLVCPEGDLLMPGPAVCSLLKKSDLRPHLLVYPNLMAEFAGLNQADPNCVVIGDAAKAFTYENMNKAFQVLINIERPRLFSMGRGKYYKEGEKLNLDVGAYMKALEFACDVQAEIIGKPSKAFFHAALNDIGVKPENALMIGDDLINDVGGAQAAGMRGVLVRTGKYRPQDENHLDVKPDGIVDNLAQAVDLFLTHRQ